MEYMARRNLKLPVHYEKMVSPDSKLEILKYDSGDNIHYRFRGYASTFNTQIDRPEGVTTIKPGAFSKTLKENPHIPLLFDHQTSQIIGRVVKAVPDNYGLKIEAEVAPTSLGLDCFELIKRRMLSGLSIGFEVVKSELKKHGADYWREILEIKLHEISACATPADNLSRIQGVGVEVKESKPRIAASRPSPEVMQQLSQIQLNAAVSRLKKI